MLKKIYHKTHLFLATVSQEPPAIKISRCRNVSPNWRNFSDAQNSSYRSFARQRRARNLAMGRCGKHKYCYIDKPLRQLYCVWSLWYFSEIMCINDYQCIYGNILVEEIFCRGVFTTPTVVEDQLCFRGTNHCLMCSCFGFWSFVGHYLNLNPICPTWNLNFNQVSSKQAFASICGSASKTQRVIGTLVLRTISTNV